MTIDEIKAKLVRGDLIELTCKGPDRFSGTTGYVGNLGNEGFEFEIVINQYEHFSNISAPAKTRSHFIRYEHVVDIKT